MEQEKNHQHKGAEYAARRTELHCIDHATPLTTLDFQSACLSRLGAARAAAAAARSLGPGCRGGGDTGDGLLPRWLLYGMARLPDRGWGASHRPRSQP